MKDKHATRIKTVASEDKFRAVIRLKHSHTYHTIAIHAMDMITRWGPVVIEYDGYDDAGRQKGRSLTAEETVTKAFDLAEEASRQAFERDLILEVKQDEEEETL